MSSRYRIVIETEVSGKRWYFVQKLFLGIIWMYSRECRDISMYRYRMQWDKVQDAADYVESEKANDEKNKLSKIKRRDFLNVPK